MIDFHSHFLPRMDDGSASTEQSMRMLRTAYRQGVDQIVATSHFYGHRESPEDFLRRRARSAARLPLAEAEDVPRIFLGAEVYYFESMSHSEDLRRLTIEGSEYILIEMPFVRWSDHILAEVLNVRERLHLTPYIAHLERYATLQRGTDNIEQLMREGFIIQCNAEFFLDKGLFGTGRKALKLFEQGKIHLLGSDMHNMSDRPPNVGPARALIREKLGGEQLEYLDRLGSHILKKAHPYEGSHAE